MSDIVTAAPPAPGQPVEARIDDTVAEVVVLGWTASEAGEWSALVWVPLDDQPPLVEAAEGRLITLPAAAFDRHGSD